MNKVEKTPKKKGPIRTEAVVPIIIITALVGLYFTLFFDAHLKKAIEVAGYHMIGAEVNIASLETSFTKASLRIKGFELTNGENPTHDLVKIGDIRFGLLWDALLRAKFVVEEMAVEQIEVDAKRSHPGKVKPPEPPSKEEQKPSVIEKEAQDLKDKAVKKVKSSYDQNVLGDITSMLSGTDPKAQLGNIENSLASKARLKEVETEFKTKQKSWDDRIKTLPKGPEIQALGERLSKVKVKGFGNPQELAQSIQQIDTILKEADQKIKLVSTTATDIDKEIKLWDQTLKDLNNLVKKDIEDLEKRFRIPKLDANSISRSIFQQYMNKYLGQIQKYQVMAKKYIPPNLLKKGQKDPDPEFQPRPRAKGITYEFGRTNSYPIFWIKKISISSKAIPNSVVGDLEGKITNISSNQILVGKPTIADIKGSFPGLEVYDIKSVLEVNNLKSECLISLNGSIGKYGINGKQIVESPDVNIAFSKATGHLESKLTLVDFKKLNWGFENRFNEISYNISAKNQIADDILKKVFQGMPMINLQAKLEGEIPDDLNTDIRSNLGEELQRGFEKQVKAKIDEARAQLQKVVEESVGKEKAKLEEEFKKAKSQVDNEVKKVQDQINAQKAQGEQKIAAAKKDAEDSAKKQLGDQGQKAVDDLKKRLGF